MKLKKPNFWDFTRPNLLSYLLYPFTIIIRMNNLLSSFSSKLKYDQIKSICIGNIYIGGTGKTPSVIKLYQIFKKLGFKVCVGRKYYESHKDEHMLLDNKTNFISDKNRIKIIEKTIKNNDEIVIFDDGLQDRKIDYDCKIVCFDAQNWIGNGALIPSGPLREKVSSLIKYDAVILKQIHEISNKDAIINQIKKNNANIKIFYSEYIPKNLQKFDLSKKYLIFSGIGNPNSFKELLMKYDFNIIEEIIYPDHYEYTQEDIDKIVNKAKNFGAEIVTTEKDFSKISNFNVKNLNFLEIDLSINNEDEFINFLKKKLYE